MKKKSHMIISLDVCLLDRIQHPFKIKKMFSKLGIVGTFLKRVKISIKKQTNYSFLQSCKELLSQDRSAKFMLNEKYL